MNSQMFSFGLSCFALGVSLAMMLVEIFGV